MAQMWIYHRQSIFCLKEVIKMLVCLMIEIEGETGGIEGVTSDSKRRDIKGVYFAVKDGIVTIDNQKCSASLNYTHGYLEFVIDEEEPDKGDVYTLSHLDSVSDYAAIKEQLEAMLLNEILKQ